ncbi:trypsin-like serine protease [Nocardia sp. NRRL S-836]|uniref:trypsin-like serine protease n=1 Tax=Nocardia sp. NRRL S-836 TaxID=1519492 RepID=UPI0009E95E59|nr:trypsin-like serine protease [Nocardia sp. NRRL S-836]
MAKRLRRRSLTAAAMVTGVTMMWCAAPAAAFTGGYEPQTAVQAPWYVSVHGKPTKGASWSCSGVLTTATTVATAAHCLTGGGEGVGSGTVFTVYRGTVGTTPSQAATKPTIISPSTESDLGRLFLPKGFDNATAATSERSPIKTKVTGKSGYLYGTGLTPSGPATSINRLPVTTAELKTPVRAKIAANHTTPPQHACPGDSGGPLMIWRDKTGGGRELVLAGLIITGAGTCPLQPTGTTTVVAWTAKFNDLFVAATPQS